MSDAVVDILMYHSISDGLGPTRISADTFREQMTALAERGYRGVALSDLLGWFTKGAKPPGKIVVLTFDDGYEDFATCAFPMLQSLNWSATVFLPTAKMGGAADWDAGADGSTNLQLMSWETVKQLAGQGIEFGAHGVRHRDLTKLSEAAASMEIRESRVMIEERLSTPVTTFAAPFGKGNAVIRNEIRKHYQLAVGTTLSRARRTSDRWDLPRIEMWYFRNLRRWQRHLDGKSRGYLHCRRCLRQVKKLVTQI